MAYTENLSQSLAVAADGIHAASQSASEKLTGAVDLLKFKRAYFLIDTGTMGSSATLDFTVKASATSGGSYTAVSGSAITQLVKATDDNKYAIVEVSSEKILAAGSTYRYIKGSLTPGTAACTSAVIVLGSLVNYEPASQYNATTVAQTVALT